MPRVRAHHLALLVVGLLLVSTSAYAGQRLGKNTVGSLQVRNNSLVSKDLKNGSLRGLDLKAGTITARQVRDGSLRRTDLGRNALVDTRLIIRSVAAGASVEVFSDPQIGTLTFGCGGTGSVSMFFGVPVTAVPATASVVASDIADNNPVGGATLNAPEGSTGGGVGYSGGSHVLPQGDVFAATRTAALHAAWTASAGTSCVYRVELTIDRTQPTGFFPRPSARLKGATCSATIGAATCRVR